MLRLLLCRTTVDTAYPTAVLPYTYVVRRSFAVICSAHLSF